MMENKDDALKINMLNAGPEVQYMTRINIIRMSERGIKTSVIAELLGVNRRHVSRVKKAYREGGIEALNIGLRGRRLGEKRRLTPEQEKAIKEILLEKTPGDVDVHGCLWTRQNVKELIEKKYNIALPIRTVGEYLKRWGLTPQRPVKHERKQDVEAVKKWTDVEYPEICKKAQEENAVILFSDETNIQNTTNYMKGYAIKGHPPVMKVESDRFKSNVIAAISRGGYLRFMLYKEKMTSPVFIKFLTRILSDRIQKGKFDKVFLIVDNLRVHRSQEVKDWLKEHEDHIQVFYLPAYSPEYNPDEFLNSDLKRGVGSKFYPRSEKELKSVTYQYLNDLGKTKDKISSFFNAPTTQYTGFIPQGGVYCGKI